MKPIVAEWTYLWLESQHLSGLSPDDIEKYILEGANIYKNPEVNIYVRYVVRGSLTWYAVGEKGGGTTHK
jgi:hypothetical protein